jgi:hypothetical protein
MSMFLTKEQEDEIVTSIDWHSWKHSWHLPRNGYGGTDWNVEAMEKCKEVLEGYRSSAIKEAARCNRLVEVLDTTIADRIKSDKEEECLD